MKLNAHIKMTFVFFILISKNKISVIWDQQLSRLHINIYNEIVQIKEIIINEFEAANFCFLFFFLMAMIHEWYFCLLSQEHSYLNHQRVVRTLHDCQNS